MESDYFSYIIYSAHLNRYYVGHCREVEERLSRHNGGNDSSYTKRAKDWQLKWTERFATCKEAVNRESFIKKKKSRKYIESLIKKDGMG